MIYLGAIDTSLPKRKITRLCKKYNIYYENKTNPSGGEYICIQHPSKDGTKLRVADIYYRSIFNWLLYRTSKRCTKEDIIKLIQEVKEYE